MSIQAVGTGEKHIQRTMWKKVNFGGAVSAPSQVKTEPENNKKKGGWDMLLLPD